MNCIAFNLIGSRGSWEQINMYACYSLMNMRQLHSLFNEAKTWHWIVCWFLCIYLFLPVFAWCAHKIVLFWSAEQFYEHIMQKLVKTGKYTEINKKSDVKFWLNWIKYGAVSYSLSCIYFNIFLSKKHRIYTLEVCFMLAHFFTLQFCLKVMKVCIGH